MQKPKKNHKWGKSKQCHFVMGEQRHKTKIKCKILSVAK